MALKIGIPTMSLGRPGLHSLDDKLHVAAQHGFQGIELFIDDLVQTRFNNSLLKAAQHTSAVCKSLNLTVICLQPFSFYEGLLDRTQTSTLLTQKLPLWFELARILETDLIQIPANFLPTDPETGAPRTSGDLNLIVSDLKALADLGAEQGFRFVYEALCWSTHIDTWEAAWAVVKAVDRSNFGLCLDSFNLAGRIYADPAHPSGKTATAETDLETSLKLLRDSAKSGDLDIKKIFYIQLVDGERLSAPLDQSHPFYVAGQPTRMNWSRNARLFPCEVERGGYLPVLKIAEVLFEIGFEGWVSLELFSRTCADPDPSTPRLHAERGMESWRKIVAALGLGIDVPAPLAAAGGKQVMTVQHRL
ncbi:xylose isomerase-like protein [Talaromyces proteolyticus]|uniref:Xylose isomerase-like protein n=1 Tax=Talaromyces proteolyticus TaxID=1131652 RepID=A0AAD4KZB2_9EURO|nr:xylose isomerase-like protein [Talaromyces proteolyticus]KAH8703792.1 xylose isomerase-like protein [Talaromyces proteolyticus]